MISPQVIEERKRSIERRLQRDKFINGFEGPVLSATDINYEMAERTKAITYGGIGLIHMLARQSGLVDAIDRRLHLLKLYKPYRESDHVLNIAYNAFCEGRTLEDIELRRNDEVFLDALGAERIPDPTTAGDFCRRFTASAIGALQDAIDEARLNVWARQNEDFFAQATIDMDGTVIGTEGQCKKGMDVAYDGTWGYHALLLSLAETGEVLFIKNRSGNRPSQEGAAALCDRVIGLCRRGGFRCIVLRGDTKFSQTEHLDRWDADNVIFHFGYEAKPNLVKMADELPKTAWKRLRRKPRYEVKTTRRRRPDNVKEGIVEKRGYENQILQYEEVAEFRYRPTACKQEYRMLVVRKHVRVEKSQQFLFDTKPYFFYITNDWESPAEAIVFSCNHRCNQENLIEQLKNGARAFRAPVDNLISNNAYMVMTALAWNLKAWSALWLPVVGRWSEKHESEKQELLRMDFRTFVNVMMKLPCQIVRTSRKIVYRLLNWNPWLGVFRRLTTVLNC
ncbi:MAG: IS1380 family transposase [Pirellulaceae bacterium]|nr:IS1380 family transposase [Pirellulaceae bacterium]